MNLKHKAIVQRIDFNELTAKYSTRVRLTIPEEVTDSPYGELPMAAHVYVLSRESLQDMLDEIVAFSFEETFKMIKRNLES